MSRRVPITSLDPYTSVCRATYTILRTWAATDACTNRATCVQTITVQDTNPPSITCPGSMTLNYTAGTQTRVTGTATATNTSSGSSISYSDVTNSGCGVTYTM